jgi:hypothetical protein
VKVTEMEHPTALPASRDSLRAAQEELRRACALLSTPSPDAMSACGRALQTAASELQSWLPEADQARGDPGTAIAVLDLRRSVVHAQRLLQAAAEYHSNWLQRMCLMASGYTSDGRAGALEPAGRVSLRA